MNIVTGVAGIGLPIILASGLAVQAANAGQSGLLHRADWYSTTKMENVPSAAYRRLVDRQLYDAFGHGGAGRNLYCEGAAVVAFQILPDGTVRHAHLVKPSLVSLNARLIASISNLQFPAYDAGSGAQPVRVTFRYGTWDLAEPALRARTNCR